VVDDASQKGSGAGAAKSVVPKLWYAYQWWYAKAFKVVHE